MLGGSMDVSDKGMGSATDKEAENSSADDASETYGCSHYRRRCSLVV